MPSFYTSKKLSFNNAEQFKESFFEPDPATVGYVFIGNHVPYSNESSIPAIVDSTFDEKATWDNMFAAKKITGNDVELVIPRINWTANTRYKQYDDKINLDSLLTANGVIQPMYALTTARNVYKCLSNNANVISTVEPTGDYATANGTIFTADGYVWKYLYNVKPSNKFLTTDWIPAPISTSKLDYNVSSTDLIDGEITTIIVTDAGSGYVEPVISATAFNSGVTNIVLANTSNLSANMTVTGTGISSGTFISAVNQNTSSITISTATTAAGGGTGNNVTFSTRVFIEGDGTLAAATANVSNGAIAKITITVPGINYSYANATIYGSATAGANTANVRVILTPKFGHGYNPAKELDATNVMVVERIGAVDSTENGLISVSTTFRQYGLLRDPYKYGNTSPVISSNANTVISQTTNLTLVAGVDFTLDEFVYQGATANSAYFYGFVNSQTSNEVRLTKVHGTVTVGGTLIGATSSVSRTVVKAFNPEFEPYTGDILYAENVTKITRADGQAENVKFVIRF